MRNLFTTLGSVLAMALTLGLAAPAAHATLIVNGGFDLNANGWTPVGNDGNGGFRATGGNPGGYFIINAAGQSATDPSISQTVSGLTVGLQYALTGDFTNRYNCCGAGVGDPRLSFGIDITPAGFLTELSQPGVSYPTWHGFAVTFVASATQHTFTFTSERNGTDTEYAIDNIALNATVPAPGSLVLALSGLALFAGSRVARQRRGN